VRRTPIIYIRRVLRYNERDFNEKGDRSMDFRSLTVKELFDNPKTAAVVKEMAPQLLKYPVKMFNKKSCGEIFDRVVKVGIVPLDQAKKIEAKVNELIK
jgi:hypothetical protein